MTMCMSTTLNSTINVFKLITYHYVISYGSSNLLFLTGYVSKEMVNIHFSLLGLFILIQPGSNVYLRLRIHKLEI